MRLANRALAAILSLAIIAGAVLLVVEIIAQLSDSPSVWVDWHATYDWAARTTWDSTVVRSASIVLTVVGLIFFILEVKRPRRTRLSVADSPSGVTTSYTRHGVAAALQTAASGVQGVGAAAVTMRSRTLTVSAATITEPGRATDSVREEVTRAVQVRLDELRLQSPPKVSVRISPRRR